MSVGLDQNKAVGIVDREAGDIGVDVSKGGAVDEREGESGICSCRCHHSQITIMT